MKLQTLLRSEKIGQLNALSTTEPQQQNKQKIRVVTAIAEKETYFNEPITDTVILNSVIPTKNSNGVMAIFKGRFTYSGFVKNSWIDKLSTEKQYYVVAHTNKNGGLSSGVCIGKKARVYTKFKN